MKSEPRVARRQTVAAHTLDDVTKAFAFDPASSESIEMQKKGVEDDRSVLIILSGNFSWMSAVLAAVSLLLAVGAVFGSLLTNVIPIGTSVVSCVDTICSSYWSKLGVSFPWSSVCVIFAAGSACAFFAFMNQNIVSLSDRGPNSVGSAGLLIEVQCQRWLESYVISSCMVIAVLCSVVACVFSGSTCSQLIVSIIVSTLLYVSARWTAVSFLSESIHRCLYWLATDHDEVSRCSTRTATFDIALTAAACVTGSVIPFVIYGTPVCFMGSSLAVASLVLMEQVSSSILLFPYNEIGKYISSSASMGSEDSEFVNCVDQYDELRFVGLRSFRLLIAQMIHGSVRRSSIVGFLSVALILANLHGISQGDGQGTAFAVQSAGLILAVLITTMLDSKGDIYDAAVVREIGKIWASDLVLAVSHTVASIVILHYGIGTTYFSSCALGVGMGHVLAVLCSWPFMIEKQMEFMITKIVQWFSSPGSVSGGLGSSATGHRSGAGSRGSMSEATKLTALESSLGIYLTTLYPKCVGLASLSVAAILLAVVYMNGGVLGLLMSANSIVCRLFIVNVSSASLLIEKCATELLPAWGAVASVDSKLIGARVDLIDSSLKGVSRAAHALFALATVAVGLGLAEAMNLYSGTSSSSTSGYGAASAAIAVCVLAGISLVVVLGYHYLVGVHTPELIKESVRDQAEIDYPATHLLPLTIYAQVTARPALSFSILLFLWFMLLPLVFKDLPSTVTPDSMFPVYVSVLAFASSVMSPAGLFPQALSESVQTVSLGMVTVWSMTTMLSTQNSFPALRSIVFAVAAFPGLFLLLGIQYIVHWQIDLHRLMKAKYASYSMHYTGAGHYAMSTSEIDLEREMSGGFDFDDEFGSGVLGMQNNKDDPELFGSPDNRGASGNRGSDIDDIS